MHRGESIAPAWQIACRSMPNSQLIAQVRCPRPNSQTLPAGGSAPHPAPKSSPPGRSRPARLQGGRGHRQARRPAPQQVLVQAGSRSARAPSCILTVPSCSTSQQGGAVAGTAISGRWLKVLRSENCGWFAKRPKRPPRLRYTLFSPPFTVPVRRRAHYARHGRVRPAGIRQPPVSRIRMLRCRAHTVRCLVLRQHRGCHQ